ncbi:MAG: hypothetical protein RR873_05125 [Christensenella sp.]
MKRIICFLLVSVLCVGIVSCSAGKSRGFEAFKKEVENDTNFDGKPYVFEYKDTIEVALLTNDEGIDWEGVSYSFQSGTTEQFLSNTQKYSIYISDLAQQYGIEKTTYVAVRAKDQNGSPHEVCVFVSGLLLHLMGKDVTK